MESNELQSNWLIKFKEIIIGWRNVAFKDEAIEELAKTRASICAGCEFNKNSICSECGCPLVAKTRNPDSKCPKLKW